MSKITNMILTEVQAEHKKQMNEAKRLVTKWSKTGLLEGLKNEHEVYAMATMLDNQAKQLITEISKTGTAAGSEEWSGVALPLVRRVFAEISAKDFVSVQAMNLPSGLVFYLDFKYGTAQPGFNTTDGSGTTIQQNTLHGITNQAGTPSEGLYGAGRFGYSINDFTATLATSSLTTASWADVNYDSAMSASVAANHVKKLVLDTTSITGTYDTNGVRAFKASGSGIVGYYPAFTAPVDVTGATSATKITFYVSGAVTMGTGSETFATAYMVYHKQPTSITRGDFEGTADPSTSLSTSDVLNIPEINVALRSEGINAKTRKLKAVWSPEFAQDLNAYHAVDAESELTSVISEYISMEIDLEILDMLISNAVTVDYWSARVGQVWNGLTTNGESNFTGQDPYSGASLAYTQNNWFQTLGTKLQKVSNKIHQKTMRGGANFMVLSPDVATIVESIPGYAADTDGDKMQFAMGVQKVGALNNRFKVYKNPYMTENCILMGFRGSQFLECGAVYAPYIPLIMTPLIYDPANFTPRKGIMTRYAKKVVRPEFYGKVYVTHMNYV